MRYFLLFTLCFLASCADVSDEAYDRVHAPGAGAASLATQLHGKGNIGPAIDFYRRALAKDPSNLVALKGLSKALQEWGDAEGALSVLRQGVEARPNDNALRHRYGKLLIGLDRSMEAEAVFRNVLALDEDDSKARSGLAVALDYQGKHAAARQEYKKALQNNPDDLTLLNNMAYSYILSHRYDRAIALLENVVNSPKASSALRQNLALAYGMAGMEADAQRVARMDMSQDEVRSVLSYYQRQRAEQAVSKGAYAELGTYATEALAVAQAKRLHERARHIGAFKPVVFPEVSAPGSTPRFAVRMMGCARSNEVSRLCEILSESGVPCVPRGKGGE